MACGTIPSQRGTKLTKAQVEYELLVDAPYGLTQEEVLFESHLRHKGVKTKSQAERRLMWNEFFSKSQACLRASPLPKKFGWGFHFNQAGKILLIGCESKEYATLQQQVKRGEVEGCKALRSSRKDK